MLAFFGAGLALGLDWRVALTVGLILCLSSTAIVLQTFSEKGLEKTEGGRTAFSVLLFQDIAVIPMLALIPLLAMPGLIGTGAEEVGHSELSLVAHLDGWLYAAVVLGSIGAVIVAGHYLSYPLFRYIAASGLREAFTAAALMLVIGIAVLMSLVGLSPALGTFLAGVVLANSEFRHELETDIEPFKGLLLGLFFITVCAGIQFPLLFDNLGMVLGLTVPVMLIKALVLLGLALLFRIQLSNGWLFTLSLAQAGEFGFVLLSFSIQNNVLPGALVPILSLVVALSMFLTPVLFILYDRLILPRYNKSDEQREPDVIDESGTVIIAGIGRFGQIINRLLRANGVATVVLDHEVNQIENMRAIRIKSFFGDATRHDLLHSAGVKDATLFIVAIDQREPAVELVRHLKRSYPDLRVLARAYDRGHLYSLRDAGADHVVMETYHSALAAGTQALRDLNVDPLRAEKIQATFHQAETEAHEVLYSHWQEKSEGERFGASYQELFLELEEILSGSLSGDRDDSHDRSARGWTPPPKGYADHLE